MLGVLARRRRRADLLQADTGLAGRDRALAVVARRAAAGARLGPPGRPARPRRAPDAGVRRLLRPAARRLALRRAGPIRRPRGARRPLRRNPTFQARVSELKD